MTSVPYPWYRIQAEQENSKVSVSCWGRVMEQDGSLFPTSLRSQGRELLAGPIRLAGSANGEPLEWEEGCYLLEPSPDKAVVNGYAQGSCVIVNSTLQWEYDGAARWDVKVMPRGLTVPQVFGLEECPIKGWNIDWLHLEIPLRKDTAKLYVSWPAGGVSGKNGDALSENGAIPSGGMAMPFKPALFFGTEELGLQWVAESDEKWQAANPDKAIEVLDGGNCWIVKLHLLDSAPRSWSPANVDAPHINFTMGLILTPVRPIEKSFLRMKAVHIDCFAKIVGDYWPYLNGPVSEHNPEKVIDRLCRAGVNTLILHEKWNKIQNYWEYAVQTKEEITRLVRLCHERGIKVLPYFGYEITSPMPEFAQVQDEVTWEDAGIGHPYSGWYRVPYQRAHKVCYQSEWHSRLPEGILKCLEDFEFDGVYLDTTTAPFGCVNEKHGCGWRDRDGRLHPTYPIFATRQMMKEICYGVHARHGIVNAHPSGATIPFITSSTDFLWDGEHIQTGIWKNGLKDFSLDYFRAEYLGTNLGIPVQFIVYEAQGLWSFDMAISLSLIHGVYPRPNSILHPLDVMEVIWRITDSFGIADAQFCGYWENTPFWSCDRDAVKLSYYRRDQADGTVRLLIYTANPTSSPVEDAVITLHPEALGLSEVRSVCELPQRIFLSGDKIRAGFDAYSLKIYEAVLS